MVIEWLRASSSFNKRPPGSKASNCDLKTSYFQAEYINPPYLGTRQFAHIVDNWVQQIGLDPGAYAIYAIRRTKASFIYRRTKNLRVVQLLYDHVNTDMASVEDGMKWAAMQADWQAVNQEARTARVRVTQAFMKSAATQGAGPTTGQLDLAEKLEQAADEKRLAMDEFLKQVFD